MGIGWWSDPMAKRGWNGRHTNTNVLVGKIVLDIPKDVLDPRYSPRPYHLAVIEPIEIVPVMAGSDYLSRLAASEMSLRTAIINTRRSLATLWVEKASELYGVPGYAPWW